MATIQISTEKFLTKINPQTIHEKYKHCTCALDCLNSQSSSLFKMNEKYGEKNTKLLMVTMFVDLSEFLGVKNKLSSSNIEYLVDTLCCHYSWLTMADINYVIDKAKRGKYGELYENLTAAKIFKWFDDYTDERCNAAEQRSIDESNKMRNPKPDYLYGDVNKLYKTWLDKKQALEEELRVEKLQKEQERKEQHERDVMLFKKMYGNGEK
jgi:hypothetical protein